MRTIELTKRQFALVDDADFEELNQYHWYAEKTKTGKYYAARSTYYLTKRNTSIKMHVHLIGKTGIDHIDRNGLNNQRHNLRFATVSENNSNRDPWGEFKIRGLSRCRNKFRLVKYENNKRIHMGMFDTIDAVHEFLAK